MTDVAGVRARIAAAGWRLLGDFVALAGGLAELLRAARGAAPAPLAATPPVRRDAARRSTSGAAHGGDYGYAFFVAEP